MRLIQIAKPDFGNEEILAVKKALRSGWITQGPFVKEFEKKFSELHNAKHALAVSNCTTALHLSLLSLGIGPGDEVIVPAFTWVATANAVLYCGAKPVFADIDISTFNISPSEIKKHITKKTKAIIPVHLFGLSADMDAIRKIAPQLKIVEDAACAAGAVYKSKPVGTFGDLGCFSFHPRKSITTGEGGMITTNNDTLAGKIDVLRNHGASVSEEQRHKGPKPYILPEFDVMGFNYRMTDLQGAIGTVQIKKLHSFIDERQHWANFYSDELKNISWLQTPVVPENYRHGWQSYVLMIDEKKSPYPRNKIMEILQSKGISTRPGTHAVHMLGYYAKTFRIKSHDFPGAYACNEYSMSVPLHNKMVKEDYEYVVDALKSIK